MKLKKILTCIAMCLCSIFCLAGCSNQLNLSKDDINNIIVKASKTNEERFYEDITKFYNNQYDKIEMNLSKYEKTFSGLCLKEFARENICKYTDGKKVKYHVTEWKEEQGYVTNNYEVADYSNENPVFIKYDLINKTARYRDSEEAFDGIFVESFNLAQVVTEFFSQVEHIALEKLSNGNIKYNGLIYYSDNTCNYVEVVFNGSNITFFKLHTYYEKFIEEIIVTLKYNIKNFNIDVGDCEFNS